MTTITPKKRRNTEETKARIILSAQKVFSERGYAQTGLRDIAKDADVTSPLLVTHFKSKGGLFLEALKGALNIDWITKGEKSEFGKRLVYAIFDQKTPITLPAMIALSIGDDEAARIASAFAREHIIIPLEKWLGAPRAKARAHLILMLSNSFIVYHRHLMADSSPRRSIPEARWLGRAVQELVDGSDETVRKFLKN